MAHAGAPAGRNRVDRPDGLEPAPDSAPQPIAFEDWPGPQFDPRQPESFPAFLEARRAWMLRLMERQFGRKPGV